MGASEMMLIEHPRDYSWVGASCSTCGFKVRYEIIPEGARELRKQTPAARELRRDLRDKLEAEFATRGCPHVGR